MPNQFSTTTNRTTDTGWVYSARGDLVKNGAGEQMAYDGEGRLTAWCAGSQSGQACGPGQVWVSRMVYDGEGRRVRKDAGGVSEYYVYGSGGEIVAEYGSAGTAGVQYLTTDGLGSTRVVTDGTGLVASRMDYEPYGTERDGVGWRSGVVGYGGGGPRLKFTSKERDSETGLDYFGARYLSAAMGRFTGADKPFADQDPYEPQSWNLYSYVRNNTLKFVDETGREIVYANDRLRAISDQRRQESPSYNANLQGFEGPGSPRLVIQYGATENDIDGSRTLGMFLSKIAPAVQVYSSATVFTTNPAILKSGSITVNSSLENDNDQTSNTLAHEVSHAADARTNPQRYSTEQPLDANGRIIPHDNRPVERRAIAGAQQSNRQRQEYARQQKEEQKRQKEEQKKREREERERRKKEQMN